MSSTYPDWTEVVVTVVDPRPHKWASDEVYGYPMCHGKDINMVLYCKEWPLR